MPVSSVTDNSQTDARSHADLDSLIGSNVSDLVQGTISVQSTSDLATSSVKPDVISDCNEPVLTSSSNHQILSSDASNVKETETNSPANLAPLPAVAPPVQADLFPPKNSSLLEQLTPESFTLGTEVKEKKRITKADFFKPKSGMEVKASTKDPFADLDPMWGLKK